MKDEKILRKKIGRQSKFESEEERRRAVTASKTKYMMNKEWRCEICGNHDYKLAGKWSHLMTSKHFRNIENWRDQLKN